MALGDIGVGERLALIAGGALALALVQLLQTNLGAGTTEDQEKPSKKAGSSWDGAQQVTRPLMLYCGLTRRERKLRLCSHILCS